MRPLGVHIDSIEVLLSYLEDNEISLDLPIPNLFADLGDPKSNTEGWIAKWEALENLAAHYEAKEKIFALKKKRVQAIITKLKDFLTAYMLQGDLKEIKCGLHEAIKLHKNSNPSLKLRLPTKEVRIGHYLPTFGHEDLVSLYPEFFEEWKGLKADTDAIKNALKAGRQLDFADIEYGLHVRLKL